MKEQAERIVNINSAMKPERWQQLDQLFHSALEREPSARAAFLDEACGGNDSLNKQVEALLIAQEKAGSFIEQPALNVEARSIAYDGSELISDLKSIWLRTRNWIVKSH